MSHSIPPETRSPGAGPGSLLSLLGNAAATRPAQLQHLRELPAREASTTAWPPWLAEELSSRYQDLGITEPWEHQIQAAESAHAGQHTIIATGTASGKSLAYQLPTLQAIQQAESQAIPGRLSAEATTLYLAPTKALAADQLTALARLDFPWLRAASYDADTPSDERRWVRDHANWVLSNPDMLHLGILPHHRLWTRFLKSLRYVVIDEAHSYRGVFGSHTALVLRRLRRICRHYGADPVFLGASATSADPASFFSTLVGEPAQAITADTSPHGPTTVALWEPALTDFTGENGTPQRRTSIAETSSLLADLVSSRVRTLAFIRSRRGVEAIASHTKNMLQEVDPSLPQRVAAYRSGYLREERQQLEQALRSGELLGVASTPALELGIDISGLDAVLIAGWPGTRASFFQEIGRAGRDQQEALAVLVANDDPLDSYVIHHPEAIFDRSVEATVLDPSNRYILGPHLCAAAQELPLRPQDLAYFSREVASSDSDSSASDSTDVTSAAPDVNALLAELVAEGYVRRRPAGWFWTHPESAAGMVNLRQSGGGRIDLIESTTGTVIGHMSAELAHYQAHPGAVYLHQGQSFVVEELDEESGVALLRDEAVEYYTSARDLTEITVLGIDHAQEAADVSLHFGPVQVKNQVVSYQRKDLYSQQILSEEPVHLPAQELTTTAVWYTISEAALNRAGLKADRVPGSLHAAEHAAIGLLPLVASSDRWDIGGVSTALHADTGQATVFVYDGHPGGAGFAERGFHAASIWLAATRDAIMACSCDSGCPSCVQSPKCGNRNQPLDKAGAVDVLTLVLEQLSTE